ncbi:MAG: tRNA (adenosine(37)-N6)-threonylcarbamoyltransferase complex dimerization subunit type 1 TsaB [Candidatus Izemoplasmatales bacterium]|jgi:tRNA threonylcarbamoyladenosine biosynthesis protein TsaB|nr:tRNA (adenosine(37)-N6)-threonylcarbamoyltransferase complex dimerization subunit type 1 TsaB [Candidatus Izemoplasmatales bacterium]
MKPLKRLVIDTATSNLYLALALGDKQLSSVYNLGNHDHSVTIIPIIDEMLKVQGWTLKDIDQVIIGIGPGSYTGVRIGVSIAKMIGYLNEIDVFTVSSLTLLATASEATYVLPFIDARRNQAFMAFLKQDESQFSVIKTEVLLDIDEFKKNIDVLYEEVKTGCPKIEKLFNSSFLCKVDNIHDLVPNYLQITEAERNKK